MIISHLTTHFKNAGLSLPEGVFKNGFQFHAHCAKDIILSEKEILVINRVFNQKSQISEIFRLKCINISIIRTVLQLNEPVRGGE